MRAEIALMSGSAFAVTHHAFSSGAGRTSDGNGSHASTLKSPSYTKSVSWQHYQISILKFHKPIKHYNNKYEKQGNKPERRLWKKEPLRHGEEDGQYSWAIR